MANVKKGKHACIGIDQSYKRTGVSVAIDGKLVRVSSVDLAKMSKREARARVRDAVSKACTWALSHAESCDLVLERTRMFSQKFVSVPYIKSMGALNATIADTAAEKGVDSWSVDTRCWKSEVVGTSKGEANSFGVDEKKWPAVKLVISLGFEGSVKLPVAGRRSKGTFTDGEDLKWEYDDDACDSACMALFWDHGDVTKLVLED